MNTDGHGWGREDPARVIMGRAMGIRLNGVRVPPRLSEGGGHA